MINKLFVVRYLRGNSKSSVVKILAIISVIGISLGVLSMIVVLSVMGGFDEQMEIKTLRAQPHLVIETKKTAQTAFLEGLIPHSAIQPFSKQDVLIRTVDGLVAGGEAYGIESQRLTNIGRRISRAVQIIDDKNRNIRIDPKVTAHKQDMVLSENEVAVSYDLARSMGIFEGDEISLIAPESLLVSDETPIYQKVKVKALISTDIQDLDTKNIYYDYTLGLHKLRDTASQTQGYEIKLEDPYKAEDYKEKLKALGFEDVKTWADLNAALFYSLKMEKKLMGTFLAITVLVSSFSIISVLFLLVTEKQKDVGILKALGAKKHQIMGIFSIIGMTLGFLGIGSGTLVGLLLCLGFGKWELFRLPDVFMDTSIPIRLEPTVIAMIVLLGVVMTILSALWPAYQIAQTEPIKGIYKIE